MEYTESLWQSIRQTFRRLLMFDSLQQMLNPQMDEQMQRGYVQQSHPQAQQSAVGLAGMLIASGMLPQDAYIQGARMHREQEISNIEKQKQQQMQNERMQFTQLADWLQQNPNANNRDIVAQSVRLGVNPQNIASWLGSIGTQEQIVNDPLHGPQIFRKNAGVYEPRGAGIVNAAENASPAPRMSRELANQEPGSNSEMRTQVEEDSRMGMEKPLNRVEAAAKYKSNLKQEESKGKDTQEWRKNITKQAAAAGNILKNVEIAERAIPKMYSGTGANAKYELSKATGVNKKAVVATEIFDKTVAQIIRDMESSQAQRVTDTARDLIIATKPQLENSKEGNISVAKAIKTHAMLQKERAEAADKWIKQGGNEHEFEILWNQFEEKYPSIMLNEETGLLDSNESNTKKWKDFIFGGKKEETPEENRKENPFLKEALKRGILE